MTNSNYTFFLIEIIFVIINQIHVITWISWVFLLIDIIARAFKLSRFYFETLLLPVMTTCDAPIALATSKLTNPMGPDVADMERYMFVKHHQFIIFCEAVVFIRAYLLRRWVQSSRGSLPPGGTHGSPQREAQWGLPPQRWHYQAVWTKIESDKNQTIDVLGQEVFYDIICEVMQCWKDCYL